MNSRVITLTGIRNARDLGGLCGADGRRIRTGCLLRSAHLGEAADSDEALLKQTWRLHTVIDLRTGREVQKQPDRQMSGVEQLHMPFFDEQRIGYFPRTETGDSARPAAAGSAVPGYDDG